MFLVTVINNTNSKEFQAKFELEVDADTWISEQKSSESWGNNAKSINKAMEHDISLVLSEVIHPEVSNDRIIAEHIDDNGDVVPEHTITVITPEWTEVLLDKEYTVTKVLIDIAGTDDAAKVERLRIATEKASIYKTHLEFGETVKLYYTALINERPITQIQKDSIQGDSDIQAIMTQLSFGRIGASRSLTALKVADEVLFFQADLDDVIAVMDDFLEKYPVV